MATISRRCGWGGCGSEGAGLVRSLAYELNVPQAEEQARLSRVGGGVRGGGQGSRVEGTGWGCARWRRAVCCRLRRARPPPPDILAPLPCTPPPIEEPGQAGPGLGWITRAKVSGSGGGWCGWSGVGKGGRDAHPEGVEEDLRTHQLLPLTLHSHHSGAPTPASGTHCSAGGLLLLGSFGLCCWHATVHKPAFG